MTRIPWFVAAALACLLLSVVLAQDPEVTGRANLRERFVLTATEAVGLMPSDLAAGPEVKEIYWAPNGRHVLVEQVIQRSASRAADERRLSVYDRRSRASDVVWRFAAERGSVHDVQWLPGADVAFVVVSEQPPATPGSPEPEHRTKLLRLSAAAASSRPVPVPQPADDLTIHISPSRPIAILERTYLPPTAAPAVPDPMRRPKSTLSALRPDGSLGPQIELPVTGWASIHWTPEGAPYVRHMERGADRKTKTTAYALDLAAGRAARMPQVPALTENPADYSAATLGGLAIREGNSALSEGGVSHKLHPLWLESVEASEQPRALVSPHAASAKLSPKGDAVLYVSNRSAWVAPLVRLNRAAYDELVRKAVVTDAKMVGLAIQMYAQDYDELFPLPEHFSEGAVQPYIKDEGVTEGFSYLYPGKGLADIEKPDQTPVGFLIGPGGKAEVYADGHVKWIPDKPK